MNEESLISPTELAVLDALMAGGEALSLKVSILLTKLFVLIIAFKGYNFV